MRTVVEGCQRFSEFSRGEPVLVGVYVFGAVLEPGTDVPVVQMAFVLDMPADELTWCAQPQSCVGLPSLLEIDKAPVEWYWRPSEWPVANHVIRRPLRVWSLDGPDTAALDALDRGEAEDLRLPAPTDAELHEQLTAELAASLAHLRRVEGGFWDRDWRSAHRGLGIYPENHLWDAVHGYLDLLGATQIDQRDTHT
ncbi:hypothetical protein [Dactylosporangium sp. NPDC048998]|uniref:DUF7711 family protein n=1 Tax=Dactylosporangium sp. NPDC048998 TaxID=3363976 RepID=UPI003719EA5B